MGDYQSVIDHEIVYDDGILMNITVQGSLRPAVVEIMMDEELNLVSIATNVTYSFGEVMTKAALNTLMGMGTVFAVLILIIVLISSFALIPKIQDAFSGKKEDKKVAEDKVVEVKLPAAPTTTEKTIVTYEPKKKSFTPAAETNTVTLDDEAYDYDVYLNGQLLTAGDATLGTDNKTITLSDYASMITEGDEIIVRYFVKHEDTFTVFAPATQEPAE